jgi:hypothetical protein
MQITFGQIIGVSMHMNSFRKLPTLQFPEAFQTPNVVSQSSKQTVAISLNVYHGHVPDQAEEILLLSSRNWLLNDLPV